MNLFVILTVTQLLSLVDACTWFSYHWEGWSSCSKTCGGGTRQRTEYSCVKHDRGDTETQDCNTRCFHGHTYSGGRCRCPSWRSGQCCETCRNIHIAHCRADRQSCGGTPDNIKCTDCMAPYYSGGYGRGCLACPPIAHCEQRQCTNTKNTKCSKCFDENIYFKRTAGNTRCERLCAPDNHLCWPGTCGESLTKNCQCLDGFTPKQTALETSCQLVKKPSLNKHTLIIMGYDGETRSYNSTPAPIHDRVDMYGNFQPTSMLFDMSVEFFINVTNITMPTFISESNFGITDVVLNVKKTFVSGKEVTLAAYTLKEDISNSTEALPCFTSIQNISLDDKSNRLENGEWLCFIFTVKGGGYYKMSNKTHAADIRIGLPLPYDKTTFTRTFCYLYDNEAPAHCKAFGNCTVDPLMVTDRSVTRSRSVFVYFSNWFDPYPPAGVPSQASQIESFKIMLKEVQVNGTLKVGKDSVILKVLDPNVTKAVLNLPGDAPQLYCVMLQVNDRAGNVRKARRFILFNDLSTLHINPEKPLQVTSAVSMTNFISNNNHAIWQTENTHICLDWSGHFFSQVYADAINLTLNQILSDPDIRGMYDDTDWITSVFGTDNIDGIIDFAVVFNENNRDCSSFAKEELKVDSICQALNVPGLHCAFYNIKIQGRDVVNNMIEDSIIVYIDSSAPEIKTLPSSLLDKAGWYWLKDFSKERIIFVVVDLESGISSIELSIRALESNRSAVSYDIPIETKSNCRIFSSVYCYCPLVGDCELHLYNISMQNIPVYDIPDGNGSRKYRLTLTATNHALLKKIVFQNIEIKWSSSGEVTEYQTINCGTPQTPEYGSVSYNGTTALSVAHFHCNHGYTTEEDKVIICQTNGGWNGSVPVCKLIDCGIPSKPGFGSVIYNQTSFDSKACFSCEYGYRLDGDNESVCQNNGIWSAHDQTCNIIDCGIPSKPKFCQVIYNQTTLNSKASFACEDGYRLEGSDETACQENGTWSAPGQTCNVIDCGVPDKPTFGTVLFNKTTVNGTAQFRCEDGYKLIGKTPQVCKLDGNWNDTAPVCRIIDCGRPVQPKFGFVSLNDTTFNSKAYISCKDGYSVEGNTIAVCQSDGTWSVQEPSCIMIDVDKACQADKDNHGILWNRSAIGTTAKTDCPKNLYGNISRKCDSYGNWRLTRYSCVRSEIVDTAQKLDAIDNATAENKEKGLSDVLSVLANVTKPRHDSADSVAPFVTDGEVVAVTAMLQKIAYLSQSMAVSKQQSQGFLETTSNLLNPRNSESFKSLRDNAETTQVFGNSDGASKVLEVVSKFTEAIANTLESSDEPSRTVKTQNLVMTVSKLQPNDNIIFPHGTSQSKSSLKITQAYLKDASSFAGVFYRNLSQLLTNKLWKGGEVEESFDINSSVMDMQLKRKSDSQEEPLNITLTFHNFNADYSNPTCSFWNFERNLWDTRGCHIVQELTNSTFTICRCDHLTNFAILMNPWKTKNEDSAAISIISIVGCSVSATCLVITIVTYASLWRYMKSDRARLLMNLCTALLLSYLTFLIGSDQNENKVVCTVFAVLLHYIYLVVFFLMLSTATEILIIVIFVFYTKPRLKWYLMLSWGLPAMIVGTSAGATQLRGYGTRFVCWLSTENGLIWAFVGPALLITLVNFLQLLVILRKMFTVRTLRDRSNFEKVKSGFHSLFILLPLMGLSWIIGAFYLDEHMTWVQYVFAVMNSLQGFVIMLFHCIWNPQVRIAMLRKRHGYLYASSKRSTGQSDILMVNMAHSSHSSRSCEDQM